MSINRNRAKLNKAKTNKEYYLIMMQYEYDYCIVCTKRAGSFFYDCSTQSMRIRHRHGNGRGIYTYKYRSYKTWKYNRKTQWKKKTT